LEIRIQQVAQWWDNMMYFLILATIIFSVQLKDIKLFVGLTILFFVLVQIGEHHNKKKIIRRWE